MKHKQAKKHSIGNVKTRLANMRTSRGMNRGKRDQK